MREFNQCHDPAGKFCSGPGGLVTRVPKRRAAAFGRNDLAYDIAYAKRQGIDVSVVGNPIPHYARQSMFTPGHFMPGTVTLFINTGDRATDTKAGEVSTLRHETGHAQSMDFGEKPAQRRIWGREYSEQYAREVGAWKAAIRNAPNNRLRWKDVQHALSTYLRQESEIIQGRKNNGGFDPKLRDEWAYLMAAKHTRLLQRYGRTLRAKKLRPQRIRP